MASSSAIKLEKVQVDENTRPAEKEFSSVSKKRLATYGSALKEIQQVKEEEEPDDHLSRYKEKLLKMSN